MENWVSNPALQHSSCKETNELDEAHVYLSSLLM